MSDDFDATLFICRKVERHVDRAIQAVQMLEVGPESIGMEADLLSVKQGLSKLRQRASVPIMDMVRGVVRETIDEDRRAQRKVRVRRCGQADPE